MKGTAKVTAGLYGSNAINLYKPISLTIEDNASLYNPSSRTVLVRANGTILNINTKGIICAKGVSVPIGINTGVNDVICNIQSGIFACGKTGSLREVQAYMENYPEEETQQNIDYYYLDSENFRTLKTEIASNLYVVKVGVN